MQLSRKAPEAAYAHTTSQDLEVHCFLSKILRKLMLRTVQAWLPETMHGGKIRYPRSKMLAPQLASNDPMSGNGPKCVLAKFRCDPSFV